MLFRRTILLLLLGNYLLVSSLAGLGRVVICQDADGSIGIESEASTCCVGEYRDEVMALMPPPTSDCCTDIPLGDMPSQAASMTVSMSKYLSGDLVPSLALPVSPVLLVTPDNLGLTCPLPSATLTGPPDSRLQGIILRC